MNRAMFGLLLTALVTTIGCRDKSKTKADPAPQTAAQTAAQDEPSVKLTFSFQPADAPSDDAKAAAMKLSELVAEKTGFGIEPMFPKSYAEAIGALKKKKADIVLLSGWAFLHAHHNADGSLLVAEQREDGNSSFEAAWFVSKDADFEKLADLAGKRIAFTSPTSAPGFLFPYAKLIEDGVVKQGEDLQKAFAEVYFVGGEADALGVLLQGKVDAAAAASFAPKLYLKPEEQEKVRALGTMDGVPTHVLAVKADMELETQKKLQEVLTAIDDEELLMSALGAKKLVKRSHGDHMMPVQNAQELVGAQYMMPADPQPDPQQMPKGLDDSKTAADSNVETGTTK